MVSLMKGQSRPLSVRSCFGHFRIHCLCTQPCAIVCASNCLLQSLLSWSFQISVQCNPVQLYYVQLLVAILNECAMLPLLRLLWFPFQISLHCWLPFSLHSCGWNALAFQAALRKFTMEVVCGIACNCMIAFKRKSVCVSFQSHVCTAHMQ